MDDFVSKTAKFFESQKNRQIAIIAAAIIGSIFLLLIMTDSRETKVDRISTNIASLDANCRTLASNALTVAIYREGRPLSKSEIDDITDQYDDAQNCRKMADQITAAVK